MKPLRRKFSSARVERVRRCVERDHVIGAAREVERERAVIAEAVERAAARHASDERAVLALVEERAGLLSVPRCGEVAHAVLVDLDLVGHRSRAAARRSVSSPSFRRSGTSLRARMPSGCDELDQRADDVVAEPLETGAHELDDEPSVVAVDDERRDAVAFAVHEAACGGVVRERAPPSDGARERAVPPRGVDRARPDRGRAGAARSPSAGSRARRRVGLPR